MKILNAFFVVFFFVANSFGAPLVFKASKDLVGNETVELASFDASKYKQIRIYIETNSTDDNRSVDYYAVEDGKKMEFDGGKYSIVIDSPPAKVSVIVKGKGNYQLYVWASQ